MTFTGGRFVGTSFPTAESGPRVEIYTTGQNAHAIRVSSADNAEYAYIGAGNIFTKSTSNNQIAVDIISNHSAMRLECHSDTPHIVLKAIPTKPSSVNWTGGIAYSSLHGFIFCDGVNWYKPAGWTVV